MEVLSEWVAGGMLILATLTLLWLVSLALRNASIVDVYWGTGFVLVNLLYHVLGRGGYPPRKWAVSTLVLIWGMRLSLHILIRNWGKPEDFRYRKWREDAGASWWWRSFFKVFLLQGVILWIVSLPLLAAQRSAGPAGWALADSLALLLWGVGFFFEAVGDAQLVRFKSNPENRGQVLRRGLWRYTRHPNYFGDAVVWWSYFLWAVAAGAYWTILSPVLMTFLLRKISGVALLEETLRSSKPGYREYVESTPAFFPWFPRRRLGE